MKKGLLFAGVEGLSLFALTGCDEAVKEKIAADAKAKIADYVETKEEADAVKYIDQLVAEGKLGSANAEKIKAAIPQSLEKVKEVLSKEVK